VLSADDQELYSRHLLLDQLGGAGQEKLLAASVELDLPAPFAVAGGSCARALAAAGVGTLVLRGALARDAGLLAECRRLSPRCRIVFDAHEVNAQARIVSVDNLDSSSGAIAIEAARSVAEAAGVGALAAVEAIKRLVGLPPAPMPLALFPAREET
jgi:hypothetical protein